MGNIRYQRTAHRITSAVNCRPLKPSPRSICPAAPYPTGVHIPGIPPPAKFATEPAGARRVAAQESIKKGKGGAGGEQGTALPWPSVGPRPRRDRRDLRRGKALRTQWVGGGPLRSPTPLCLNRSPLARRGGGAGKR